MDIEDINFEDLADFLRSEFKDSVEYEIPHHVINGLIRSRVGCECDIQKIKNLLQEIGVIKQLVFVAGHFNHTYCKVDSQLDFNDAKDEDISDWEE